MPAASPYFTYLTELLKNMLEKALPICSSRSVRRRR
jgi:hypothetical protein